MHWRSNMPPLRRGCQDAALRRPDIRGSAPAHQRPRGRLVRLPAGLLSDGVKEIIWVSATPSGHPYMYRFYPQSESNIASDLD